MIVPKYIVMFPIFLLKKSNIMCELLFMVLLRMKKMY